MKVKKIVKSVVSAVIAVFGSKGWAPAYPGSIKSEEANGEPLKDVWPEYERNEVSAEQIRNMQAAGKSLARFSPSLAPFDRRRNLNERKEGGPRALPLSVAQKRGLVKPVVLDLVHTATKKTAQGIKCWVDKAWEPGKRFGTDTRTQFIMLDPGTEVFGIKCGFIETRPVRESDGTLRNAALLCSVREAKAAKAAKK